MIKKFLRISLSVILALSMSATIFADEIVGVEKNEISVLEQFIDKVIDIPITHIDDPATEKDETTNIVYGKEEGYKYTTGDVKEGDDDNSVRYMDITCEITVDAEEFEENHTYKNPPNDPPGERETGDAFNLLLVVTILLISLAGAGLVLSRRKYN